jgi:hypothetical protein
MLPQLAPVLLCSRADVAKQSNWAQPIRQVYSNVPGQECRTFKEQPGCYGSIQLRVVPRCLLTPTLRNSTAEQARPEESTARDTTEADDAVNHE